jgi:hypothetical protein
VDTAEPRRGNGRELVPQRVPPGKEWSCCVRRFDSLVDEVNVNTNRRQRRHSLTCALFPLYSSYTSLSLFRPSALPPSASLPAFAPVEFLTCKPPSQVTQHLRTPPPEQARASIRAKRLLNSSLPRQSPLSPWKSRVTLFHIKPGLSTSFASNINRTLVHSST